MTRRSAFPKCQRCDNRFARKDERALVYKDSLVCPLCIAFTLGTTFWAIKNNCNGVFEVRDTRAEAIEVCKEEYDYDPDHEIDAEYVVPAILITLTEDFHAQRALYAHWEENDREADRLRWARQDIVKALRARAAS